LLTALPVLTSTVPSGAAVGWYLMMASTIQEIDAPLHRWRNVESSWHPWLRITRVLRVMLHERWSAEAWPQVKAEFTKALALRSEIRRAGWFN
jgi:hypothetical protein